MSFASLSPSAAVDPERSRLVMLPGHVPQGGLKYWLALSAASVMGCNAGDFVASGLGAAVGLPALAAAFAAVLLVERRDRRATQFYYWTGILIVRAAATMVADLLDQSFGSALVIALLAAGLAASIIGARKSTAWNALPTIDLLYWVRMGLAGTLGTALGDLSSFATGLGMGGASLALSALVAVLVAGRSFGLLASTASFWTTVVAIRAAGTSFGDFSASHLGLSTSLCVSGLALAAIVFFRMRRPASALAVA